MDAADRSRQYIGLMRIGFFMVISSLLTICLVGCKETKALTIKEYAVEVCISVEAPEDLTWGQVLDYVRKEKDRVNETRPPSMLREYHRAHLKVLRALEDIAEDNPSGELASGNALANHRFAEVAISQDKAVEVLPDHVKVVLANHGCIEE